MSHMLEFPRSRLPDDIAAQPHVIFAIRDKPIYYEWFPTKVPLAILLHFAPKVERWTRPVSSKAMKSARSEVVSKPSVIVNIQADIAADGLAFIVHRMLQQAGLPLTRGQFDVNPTIMQSIHVLKTWKVLELPPAGTQGLGMHLHTRLMMGPPVLSTEMRGLWDVLPQNSPILVEMVSNFIRSYTMGDYHPQEKRLIMDWMSEDAGRRKLIREQEGLYYASLARERSIAQAGSITPKVTIQAQSDVVLVTRRPRSRNVSLYSEEKEAKKEETNLLRRIGSNSSMSSVETVLHDPCNPASGNEKS